MVEMSATSTAVLKYDRLRGKFFWEAFGFKSMAFYDKRQSTQQLMYFEKLLNEPVLPIILNQGSAFVPREAPWDTAGV